MGTWIEIDSVDSTSWISGVVPYVGTWIEIQIYSRYDAVVNVVPYVGTWIEIEKKNHRLQNQKPSFPTWERG